MEQQNQDLIVQGDPVVVPAKRNAVVDLVANKPIIPLAAVAVLLVTTILFVVLFAVTSGAKRQAEETIASRDAKIDTIEEEVDDLTKELKDVRASEAAYKLEADKLEEIYNFMLRTDAGESTYKFKVDKPLLVLRKNDPRKTVQLTTAYNTTYGFDYSVAGVALVEFDRERWSGSTVQLNVTAIDTGSTVVSFYNEANSETFKMMIIVID